MEVNLDVLRMSATKSMSRLADEIEGLQKYLPEYKDVELKEVFDDAARSVSLFNCVYSDNDDGFNDISEKVKIKMFYD